MMALFFEMQKKIGVAFQVERCPYFAIKCLRE